MGSYSLYLTNLNKSELQNLLRRDIKNNIILLYADFNVINLFYKNNLCLDKRIILYPDSTAVTIALYILFRRRIQSLVSTDLQMELLCFANQLKKKVFFFGDKEHVLQDLKKNVRENYQNLEIAGLQNGFDYSSEDVLNNIKKTKPDILFVGLGVGRQETWISENYTNLNVPLILSVGGWFRYLAESRRRAPKWLRELHLEWIFKLITEFNRVWQRYLIGIPSFFYRVLTKKITIDLKNL